MSSIEPVAYPSQPFQRSHSPPRVTGQRGYEKYRSCLRREFAYTCVYCLATEREVAPSSDYGMFEIEHFRPKRFKKLINAYGNLYWACHACNRAKGAKWPSEEEAEKGYRFVDFAKEAAGESIELTGDVARGLTLHGEFTVEEVNLNSEQHQERRRRRREARTRIETLRAALKVVDMPEQRRKELTARLNALVVAWRSEPWDAPADCLCNA